MSNNTDIILAGAIAAFTVDLLIYPLDTLKTRLQSPDYRRALTLQNANKRAMFQGLYQGVGSAVVATLPASGLFFTVYEQGSHLLRTYTNPNILPLSLIPVVSSSIAELASCAIITPAEVIKQNAQVLTNSGSNSNSEKRHIGGFRPFSSSSSSTLKAFSRISAVRDLWRGYGTLVGRNLPFTALQFPVFEALKKRWGEGKRKEKGSVPEGVMRSCWETAKVAGLAAGASGGVAAVVTTPVDVVKTRIMLSVSSSSSSSSGQGAAAGAAPSPHAVGNQSVGILRRGAGKGLRVVVNEVLKEEGWKGFWRGGALRGVWTFLGSGLYLGSYEAAKVWLKQRNEVDAVL